MRQPRTPPADLWSDRTVRAMNGLPFRSPPRPCPAARRDRPSEDPPQMTEPTGPLKGYRILDLTNVLFGTFGTETLVEWEIGRPTCRESGCQGVVISVVARHYKKNK